MELFLKNKSYSKRHKVWQNFYVKNEKDCWRFRVKTCLWRYIWKTIQKSKQTTCCHIFCRICFVKHNFVLEYLTPFTAWKVGRRWAWPRDDQARATHFGDLLINWLWLLGSSKSGLSSTQNFSQDIFTLVYTLRASSFSERAFGGSDHS